MYNVSVTCEKRKLRGGERLGDPRGEMCVSLAPFIADRGVSGRFRVPHKRIWCE